MLLHMESDIGGYWPGHTYRFRPAPVHTVWARSAFMFPEQDMESVLFDTWREPRPGHPP